MLIRIQRNGAITAIALVLCLIGDAHAADKPSGWRCALVRNAVAVYGESAALAWARAHGWSDSRIAEAKRCLMAVSQ